MAIITDDMRRIVQATRRCFAANVDEDGTPNLSPKSSLMGYDDDLVFAIIASPNTVCNLRRNPAIEINAIEIFARRGHRFKGTADMMPPGTPEYDFVAEPYWAEKGKQFPVHEIVKVVVTWGVSKDRLEVVIGGHRQNTHAVYTAPETRINAFPASPAIRVQSSPACREW